MRSTIIDNVEIHDEAYISSAVNKYMTSVFGWMSAALAITAFTALFVASSQTLLELIIGNRIVFYALIGAELLLVIGIGSLINRISAAVATALFLLYSIVNGATLSFIFLAYTSGSIATTFFITAGTFSVMALAGYFTKKDLTTMGGLLIMALVGLILASLVNMFLQSELLYWISSYIGVIVFVGLTAYDTQKIKNIGIEAIRNDTSTAKIAILGALSLYLDFVNLFLYLLRLFGNRK